MNQSSAALRLGYLGPEGQVSWWRNQMPGSSLCRVLVVVFIMVFSVSALANTLNEATRAKFLDIQKSMHAVFADLADTRRGMKAELMRDSNLDWCLASIMTDLNEVASVTEKIELSVYFSSRMLDARDERIVNESISAELGEDIKYVSNKRKLVNEAVGLCSYNVVAVTRAQQIASLMSDLLAAMQSMRTLLMHQPVPSR
jgi:hypothetical protein